MSFVKKASNQAKIAARQVARDMCDEMLEIPKSASSQITGGDAKKPTGLFTKKKTQKQLPSFAAVDVATDAKNFPKSARDQLFGVKEESKQDDSKKTPWIIDAVFPRKTTDDENSSQEQVVQKPQNMDEQIGVERKKREEKERKWEEEQEQLMKHDDKTVEEDAVLPSSGKRKGPALPGAKQPKSPETRKSRH